LAVGRGAVGVALDVVRPFGVTAGERHEHGGLVVGGDAGGLGCLGEDLLEDRGVVGGGGAAGEVVGGLPELDEYGEGVVVQEEGVGHVAQQCAVQRDRCAGDGRGGVVQAVGEAEVGLGHFVDVGAQLEGVGLGRGDAGGVGEAVGHALAPGVRDLVGPYLGGVDVAFQDHAVGAVLEEGAVDGAEVGAVGLAPVGDLLLAEGLADEVHVAGGVGGVVVAQVLAH